MNFNRHQSFSIKTLVLLYAGNATLLVFRHLGELRSGLFYQFHLSWLATVEYLLLPLWVLSAVTLWEEFIEWLKNLPDTSQHHIATLNTYQQWDWRWVLGGFFVSSLAWIVILHQYPVRSWNIILSACICISIALGIVFAIASRWFDVFCGLWGAVGAGYGTSLALGTWSGIVSGLLMFIVINLSHVAVWVWLLQTLGESEKIKLSENDQHTPVD